MVGARLYSAAHPKHTALAHSSTYTCMVNRVSHSSQPPLLHSTTTRVMPAALTCGSNHNSVSSQGPSNPHLQQARVPTGHSGAPWHSWHASLGGLACAAASARPLTHNQGRTWQVAGDTAPIQCSLRHATQTASPPAHHQIQPSSPPTHAHSKCHIVVALLTGCAVH
jgi:hypothetical protein